MAPVFVKSEDLANRLSFRGRIALLDTPANSGHEALRGAAIEQRDFVSRTPSTHGTIAAVSLVGLLDEWQGLLPRATLLCAGVLGSLPRRQASAEAIVKGLRWVADRDVEAIFLPFGHSSAHRGIARAIEALPPSVRIYAAAGNRGPSCLLFPASMKRVTAVSAYDEAGQISADCSQRDEVELFAPGYLSAPGFGTGGELYGTSAACIMAALDLLRPASLRAGGPK